MKDFNKIFFIGIGGIGMSALARYFNVKSYKVGGYDKTSTTLTDSLKKEGIEISFDENFIPDWLNDIEKSLIVYTPAIPENNNLLIYFKSKKYQLLKRSEALGLISKDVFTIAVAGTHGKTSTSSILAHLLHSSGLGCTAFLGGIATNYNSNLLTSSNNIMVIEADEYDRSFLHLSPDIAIITSLDADHLDIYEDAEDLKNTFIKFAEQVNSDGLLLVNNSIEKEFITVSGVEKQTYSVDDYSLNIASNLKVKNHRQIFDVNISNDKKTCVSLENLQLSLAGSHNVSNALSAIVVAHKLGLSADQISDGINSFKGVKRRFEVHCENEHIYIDDYAHHPKEIKVTIEAVKMLYPDKKLSIVFQPHLFSRTKDFFKEFAYELSSADEVILLDVYPARELPILGVDSNLILDNIPPLIDKKVLSKDKLIESISNDKRELLVTLGAGDIDKLVHSIKSIYK